MIEIYCDGATSKNGSAAAVGGWAFVVLDQGEVIKSASGAVFGTTNQRMELTAAVNALLAVKSLNQNFAFCDVRIMSDSAYVVRAFKECWIDKWLANGWVNSKKEPVANRDLWEMLYPLSDEFNVDWIKVKGHANSHWNNVVDEMAVNARLAWKE